MILHTLLRFQDFISEHNYASLQYKFASYDEAYSGLLECKFEHLLEDDFTIQYKYDNDNFKELSFYNDFLYPKIDSLGKSIINRIQQKINTDFKYDKVKIEFFMMETLGRYYDMQSTINSNTFLKNEIREKLSIQIEIVLEYLNADYLINFEFKNKFQFKLIEQDLLVLIALLRKGKKIVNENESQLGHLIERHFECFDETASSYKKIQNAGKKLNNYKNNFKTVEKSIVRLKELLQNDSFYEL
ncbi:MAG: hypothetical protein KKH44_02625 [Bacteroidetes bacterium]|nr:hypothetical protein [Bacteroidota bacterium]